MRLPIDFVFVFSLKIPEVQADIGEDHILLDEPSPPLFKMKQPQTQSSSTISLIPQASTKLEDNNEQNQISPQTQE